jgi:hypothetical protein
VNALRSTAAIRVAIEPEITERYGPEIHWTLRLLLTSAGWAWREVTLAEPSDLAVVRNAARAPQARLIICAQPEAWERRGQFRLRAVGRDGDLAYPSYSEDTPGQIVYRQGGRLVCRRDVLFDVFWLATGQEERYWPQDRHGFYDLSGTFLWQGNVLDQALASQIGLWLKQTLLDLGCPAPRPVWPNGKRAAAVSGHDVDYPEVKRAIEPLRVLARQGLRGLQPAWEVLIGARHHWQFPAWISLEQALGFRSTFYFVARQGSLVEYAAGTPDPFYDVASHRFRALFQELREQGFEIGLHASYLAHRSAEQFAWEKRRLENASGHAITGNRHHYWHLNPANVDETLLIHEQVGLHYDSSLTHNRYLGWRRGLNQPYFPFVQAERREIRTLQLPIAWMDDQLFSMKADNPGEPLDRLTALVARAAEQQGTFVIDMHEYVLDDRLFPRWAALYTQICRHIVERGDFWFATAAEVGAHWAERYQALLRGSTGLHLGLPADDPAVEGILAH